LERRGADCHGVAEHPQRHDIGQERLGSRHHEGARDTEERQHAEYRQHACVTAPGKDEQQQGTSEIGGKTAQDDDPAVVAVGGMSGKQRQAQKRQELRQPDQAQVQNPAGQVIHLPAHRDDDHLRRERREQSRAEIQDESALPEDGEPARNQSRAQAVIFSGALQTQRAQ
jgi:hypothetical protein